MGKIISIFRSIDPLGKLCLGVIGIMALVNLIAVFAPEMGFDALWYHLTLTKLFISQHRWYFPGGLMYYSAMPRLAETLFIPLLQLLGTTGPKLLQYVSGLISTYFVYQTAREFYDQNRSLLGALLFYTAWLVGWQSGSAYVDLLRTMFEVIALYFVIQNKFSTTIFAGLALGLAIGVKWHALGTMLIFGAFFSPLIIPVALATASPWFFLAHRFTGNPIYPLFESFMTTTQLSQTGANFFQPVQVAQRILLLPLSLAFPYDDLLNPIISLLFSLGIFYVVRQKNYQLKTILIVALSGLIYWQLTPPPSGRYLLPFLPAIIIVSLSTLNSKRLKTIATSLVVVSAIVLLWLRTYANSKYLPVVLGRETTNQFLTANSAKLPGTFIDTDGWVAQNIPPNATVLVEKWHNLYYLPVSFDHTTWSSPITQYEYLITTGVDPKSVSGKLLHINSIGAQIFQL